MPMVKFKMDDGVKPVSKSRHLELRTPVPLTLVKGSRTKINLGFVCTNADLAIIGTENIDVHSALVEMGAPVIIDVENISPGTLLLEPGDKVALAFGLEFTHVVETE